MLSLARIAELSAIESTPQSISFGANVTWSQVETALRERLPQFRRIVERFGSPQIRNVATLVGNIANGSPIADSLPLLMVMDAQLEIVGPRGSRTRSINGFYAGYKKMDLRRDELITRVILPLPKVGEKLRLYKVSRRTDLDISTFGAAIRIQTQDNAIRSAAIAYAGVAPTVVRLPATEAMLVGKPFDENTFREAGRRARAEVTPITDVRGSADFRLQLCENVAAEVLLRRNWGGGDCVSVIGQPLPHESAREHVRGTAAYVDDLPPIRGELIVDFVGSPVAHGRIVAIDVEAARKSAGIVAVLTAADVPENLIGPVFHDEDLLAREIVYFHGQPIVAIAGESREAVARAKKLVQIKIDPLPAVLTIENAIAQNQFIGPEAADRTWRHERCAGECSASA